MGRETPASLDFLVEIIKVLWDPRVYLGALSVRLRMGSLVFIAACHVRSTCFLHLVVPSSGSVTSYFVSSGP